MTRDKFMNQYNSQLISSSILAALIFLPELSLANDSWTGFVPPSSSKANIKITDSATKWRKDKWRSGSNYNTPQRFKFNTMSSENIQGQEYALTEPQRKSVNPWVVNKSSNR